MTCMVCEQDPCACLKDVAPMDDQPSASSSTPPLARKALNNLGSTGLPLRIMSWNVERLGDTGSLGKHNGFRPQYAIDAIAKIIQTADVHIFALIEVFTDPGCRGEAEVERIRVSLQNQEQQKGSGHVWRKMVSTGPGTGGVSEPDGSKRQGREGYAVFWRASDGINCRSCTWLNIYGTPPLEAEEHDVTSKGRAYIRDACQFWMVLKGHGKLFPRATEDLQFPITVFHAPGPRADVQRQARILGAIRALFTSFTGPTGCSKAIPNAFICADFNASEDADNLLAGKAFHEVDYSFPTDLEYLARLIKIVTKVKLLEVWALDNEDKDKKKELSGLDWAKKGIAFSLSYLGSAHFEEIVLKKGDFSLTQLEQIVDRTESWFTYHPQQARLTGINRAKAAAAKLLEPVILKLLQRDFTPDKFEAEKQRFKQWRSAANAKTHKAFSNAYWALEDVEGAHFLDFQAITQHNGTLATWQDLQAILKEAFEDEFEGQEAFLGSRSMETYTKKVIKATMSSVKNMLKNARNQDVEDSYDAAFAVGSDSGFGESTAYDDSLKTTRRKQLLLTGLASCVDKKKYVANRQADLGTVRCSKYDKVLPRTDGVRMEVVGVEAIPVLECVLPQAFFDSRPTVPRSRYSHCCQFQSPPSKTPHPRFLLKVCATAHALNIQALPTDKAKVDYWVKKEAAVAAWEHFDKQHPSFCCQEECISVADFTWLNETQRYLDLSHALSDHEPIVLTTHVYPAAVRKTNADKDKDPQASVQDMVQ